MRYPLIEPQLLAQLRLAHGIVNAGVMLFFPITRGSARRSEAHERRKRRCPFP